MTKNQKMILGVAAGVVAIALLVKLAKDKKQAMGASAAKAATMTAPATATGQPPLASNIVAPTFMATPTLTPAGAGIAADIDWSNKIY